MNRWRLPLAIALAAIVAACDGGAASDTTAPGVETTVGVANTQPSTDDTEPRTDDTTTDDTEPRTDDTSTDVTEPRTDDTGSATADTGADGGETIVDVAAGTGRFATLLSVIEATGLTESWPGQGLTLFAPTDDAFASERRHVGGAAGRSGTTRVALALSRGPGRVSGGRSGH